MVRLIAALTIKERENGKNTMADIQLLRGAEIVNELIRLFDYLKYVIFIIPSQQVTFLQTVEGGKGCAA